MNIKSFHYRFRRFCAFLIGVVFLMAGIFKLLDPVGAGLVVEEYLKFLHLGFFMPAAKVIAVALALLEALLGAAMISGVWRKPVAWTATAMIVFFTILTAFLLIFNPSMDCGCFGEVIHLTNLQTFLKNLVLLALAMGAFLPFRNFGKNKKRKYVSFSIVAASLVAFMCYSLVSIPLVDYTDFKPGSELSTASENAESGEDDYMSTFIYEKNGREGAFTLDNLPDSTWTFVRTETIRKNGPEVDENKAVLAFSDSAGTYEDSKAGKGDVLAVSAYDPLKVKGDSWTRIAELLGSASEAGFTPLLIVASTKDSFENMRTLLPEVRSKLNPYLYFADRRVLVSLNRSNGGATRFSDGQLIQKFPSRRLPSDAQILAMTGDDPTDTMLSSSTKGRLHFQGFILYVFVVLLIL